MSEIDTVAVRVEREMDNWFMWQNTAKIPKLGLNNSGEPSIAYVNEADAKRVEKGLLVLRSINKKYYETMVTYYNNRHNTMMKDIAKMLKIAPNTMKHRRDCGIDFMSGYLF